MGDGCPKKRRSGGELMATQCRFLSDPGIEPRLLAPIAMCYTIAPSGRFWRNNFKIIISTTLLY